MKFKTQADLVKDNCGGMERLQNPHNFSSNPGWLDEATAYAKKVASNVSQGVQKVKEAYHSGSQETESIGKELAAKQQMMDQARIALKPTDQPQGKPDGK